MKAAIKTNDAVVAIAKPISHLFKAQDVPLGLPSYITSGICYLFFRILLTPIF